MADRNAARRCALRWRKAGLSEALPLDWQQLAQAVRGQGDKLWETYYSSIFNPARLNPKVMQGHMPLRFGAGIPEGKLIQGLVSNARAGSQKNGQAEAVAARGEAEREVHPAQGSVAAHAVSAPSLVWKGLRTSMNSSTVENLS